MPTYVAGADITSFVGVDAPDAGEVAWAAACAAAVQAAIDTKMTGVTVTDPSPAFDELKVAALIAGAEAFKRKEATFGLTGYADLQGAAIRVARDYTDSVNPIIGRYRTDFGIG